VRLEDLNKKKMIKFCLVAILSVATISGCTQKKDINNVKEGEIVGKYTFLDEKNDHEGTWVQWHHGLWRRL